MILVTGGTGFIGSHTVVELHKSGFDTVIIDDLSNSDVSALDSIEKITGKRPVFYEGDVCNGELLERIFKENEIDAVIHFANLKAVGESVEKPIEYYSVNLNTSLVLASAMKAHGCKRLIFSSSATVYGPDNASPYTEDMRLSATNPYGWTKVIQEQILSDIAATDPEFSLVLLRYFNPVGAHESGLIGERPNGIPNNLMPYICDVASKKMPQLSVFGNDYDTPDGTGVRDFIHVCDLADGHIAALHYAKEHKGVEAFNLGTGKGNSVLELISTFERVNGVPVPYRITDRRPGDLGTCYASTDKAARTLGWRATHTLEDMCRDSYNFVLKSSEMSK